MNAITIAGRATKDPIEREGKYGTVCFLTVAVNTGKDKTDYFNVSLSDNAAQRCMKYVKKGDLVCVKGSVHLNQWGNNREHASLAVKAKELEFFGKREQSCASAEAAENETEQAQDTIQSDFEEVDDYDMPF